MGKHECNCNENEEKNGCGCGHNHEHEEGHECGCGHDHEHEEMPLITLGLDDGTELECNVAGVFSYKDKEYIALVPVDEEEAIFYTYEEQGEEMVLNNIEDDEEYDKIADYFFEITSEEE
jgi:uncharacterized protein YrzB (UPF0473 family)